MKSKTITILFFFTSLHIAMAAETAKEPNVAAQASAPQTAAKAAPVEEEMMTEEPALPAKESTEYWVIRSEAMTDFIPFLTKKRTEVKQKAKLLADYLVQIGKADEFADLQLPIVFNTKVYADILQIGEGARQMNAELPKERPSWDQLVEFVMKYIVYEGYLPTEIEEGEDAAMYIAMCKKKEEYGQKVRKDIRTVLDQAARVWVYLDSIGQLGEFKAHVADLILEKKAMKAQEKAMQAEEKREMVVSQAQAKEERKFEDAEERASFRSSRRERGYGSRQDHMQYRQSRLDERMVNSRGYYY